MATPDRQQRLAAKLRENLRRRKAQAKARDTESKKGDGPDDEVLGTAEEDQIPTFTTKSSD